LVDCHKREGAQEGQKEIWYICHSHGVDVVEAENARAFRNITLQLRHVPDHREGCRGVLILGASESRRERNGGERVGLGVSGGVGHSSCSQQVWLL
jgi:hypothetical protein